MNYGFLLESVWHPPLAFEEVAAPKLPPELELQALWFSGAFGRNFRLKDGRALRITQFGEWNHGAGPDFAHAAIALCRAFNLPARYVTGHLPDIGVTDPGSPMDFHAYLEVYLGQEWLTFDPRFNVPRIGRVKVAHGADAVDGAFATIFGEARLTHFEVWAYQIRPGEVNVGDPVDLSKRLDGTPTLMQGTDYCGLDLPGGRR